MGSYPKYGPILLLIFNLPWKFSFLIILVLGSLIAISASSWFIAWIGLEINILALLALFLSNSSPRNSEATFKYFLVQAFASRVLIASALIASGNYSFIRNLSSTFIIILRLFVKLGVAPFHVWVPQIIEGLKLFNSLIVLTWQKVAPFFLLVYCLEEKLNKNMFYLSLISSAVIGALAGLRQTSLRKIIAFSSINHIGWIMIALVNEVRIWLLYFFVYSIMLHRVIVLIDQLNLTNLSNLSSNNSFHVISLSIILMSFGGLPPFIGFFPKWMIISRIHDSAFIMTILVVSRLVTLFFYIRIIYPVLLFKVSSIKSYFKIEVRRYPLIVNIFGLLGLIIFI